MAKHQMPDALLALFRPRYLIAKGPDGRPTHDYRWDRLGWGYDWYIVSHSPKYDTMVISAFGLGVEAGHDMLISRKSDGGVACYRIGDDLKYETNPTDAWKATVTYLGDLTEEALVQFPIT